jgi:hypothetical protein
MHFLWASWGDANWVLTPPANPGEYWRICVDHVQAQSLLSHCHFNAIMSSELRSTYNPFGPCGGNKTCEYAGSDKRPTPTDEIAAYRT